MLPQKRYYKYLPFILMLLFSLYSTVLNVAASQKINFDNSLVLLANQFIHRHISLEAVMGMPIGDISKFGGKFYLYFGPSPSIILMPFVLLFGKNIPQVIVGIGSMIASFYAIFCITKAFKFKTIDSLWLSLFFVFSTVLYSSSVINITAYQVEAMGIPLVLLALSEYFVKKRSLIIGLFLAFAVLTRATLILGAIFFLLEFLQKRLNLKQLILLLIPLAAGCILFGIYNFVRFHSLFETGYKYNITLHSYPLSLNLDYGYMSVSHIPANLYSLLVMPPQPLLQNAHGFVLKFPYLTVNPWGLAIWYTSPLFLWLLIKFKKNMYTLSALITCIVIAIPLLLYYSVGFAQFGYRYALDFLPFLFLLLIPCLSLPLSKKELGLISVGIIFNCVYLLSSWGIYPLFGLYN